MKSSSVPSVVKLSEDSLSEDDLSACMLTKDMFLSERVLSMEIKELYDIMGRTKQRCTTEEQTNGNLLDCSTQVSDLGDSVYDSLRIDSLEHEVAAVRDENLRLMKKQNTMEKQLQRQNELIAKLERDILQAFNKEMKYNRFIFDNLEELDRKESQLGAKNAAKGMRLRDHLKKLSKMSCIPC